MLGLNIYSFVQDISVQFYKAQKAAARTMDIFDWIPGAYSKDIEQGGLCPMDIARSINDEEFATPVPFEAVEPLAMLHPGDPAPTEGGDAGEEEVEDEDVEEEEEEDGHEDDLPVGGDVEEGATGFTQESEAPLRKKAMRTATPQSKLVVPTLTIADAREMYSRDATETFRERRKLKGKKLYGEYSVEETIAISSEDEDDFELGKRLREEPTGPRVIPSNINPKPEALTVEEANRRHEMRMREEEHRAQLARAAADEPSVRDEVAQLKALVLMMAQGFGVPTPAALPQPPPQHYYPPSGPGSSSSPYQGMMHPQPVQYYPPPGPGSSSSPYQGMMHPPTHRYAPVQQVDDLHLWRQGTPGHSRPLTPPPLRPPTLLPPPHQQDDPRMFGSADPNPTAAPSSVDDPMVEAEGQQRPGDTSTPNPVDDPMHDAREETGLVQRPESQSLNEQVAAEEKEEDGGVHAQEAAQSTASRPEEGEVML